MYRLTISAVVVCIALMIPAARAAAPSDVIQEAVDLLTEGLDGRKEELTADKDALYAFIDGILLPRFDRRFAASAVLMKHWRTATDEQKERFVEAFYVTLLHRYAEGILEFDMERVEILPYRGNAKKRTTVVKTRVRLDDGTKIPVHYTLVNREDQWRMFDVKIEGVSYVINYRKEMDSEIRGSSLDKVIERLENDAGTAADE
ncbi:MAG: ABC transporter substrate-binding protein [Planctomycetota bacterium]|nr:ABC transporter substrate-binding protein [Planctomycetota bacterium]